LFVLEPQIYNGVNYYWHHGGWWRQPHTHGYFNSPLFGTWYQNRYGNQYQGFQQFNQGYSQGGIQVQGGYGGGYGGGVNVQVGGGYGGGYGGGVDVQYNYDGSVTIEPENIPLPVPQGVAFTTQPQMYNGVGYYYHHGGWWRHPHTHGYFNSQRFSGWYQIRYGNPYQGFDYYNNNHHHHHQHRGW